MNIRITASIAILAATTSLSAQITHTHLGTIQTANQEGEIVAFDSASGRYFVTNPASDEIDVFTASATGSLAHVMSIPLAGAPNSVAVHNGLVAVAVEGPTKQDSGQVQFFQAATGVANGLAVTVGALPDMVAFTPNGQKVLTANEGEADEATGLNNPEGSVSIVDVASRTVATASFAPWNGQKASLQAAGVRLTNVNNITLAQAVEPGYVTINAAGTTAYVPLRANDAIAAVENYFIKSEHSIVSFFHRHFYWFANILWAHELHAPSAVILADSDGIVPVKEVEAYLKAEGRPAVKRVTTLAQRLSGRMPLIFTRPRVAFVAGGAARCARCPAAACAAVRGRGV